MSETIKHEVLKLTQRLLNSISQHDWTTYAELCDPSLTCFEPEALGHVVEGLDFHKFYFDLPTGSKPPQHTITSPHVRLLRDDVAIVSYVRLTQSLDANGSPQTSYCEETRVWQRHDGHWRHIHFHRSKNR